MIQERTSEVNYIIYKEGKKGIPTADYHLIDFESNLLSRQ